MENTNSNQSQLRAIEDFLRDWDPIGVATKQPSAADKYDKYAPVVLRQLQARSSVDVLTDNLIFLTVSEMGIPPNVGPSRRIAERLCAWWASQKATEGAV